MPSPSDPIRVHAVKACLPDSDPVLLVCSSPSASACELALQESGLDRRHCRVMAWTEAEQHWACQSGEGAVWVLEPDPAQGPNPKALSQALWGLPSPPLVLVLLPPSLTDATPWLDAGADRCLPAHSTALLLRAMVRALLRRCRGVAASISAFGPLHFDHLTQTLFSGGQHIWLTCRETQVCAVLFRNGAQCVSSLEVLKALAAGAAQTPNKALVALYVHRVNRKMRAHGVQINLQRGHGYRLSLMPPSFSGKARTTTSSGVLSQWLHTPRLPTPSKAGPCP